MPFPETTPHPLLLGLRRSGLIAAGDRVLVAVSGGPDSTALLLALHEEGHDMVAAHYDHALQAGLGPVSDHFRLLCERVVFEALFERRESPVPRRCAHDRARALRYYVLLPACRQAG